MTDVTLYGCTANASVTTDDKLVSTTGATATILTTKVAKLSGYGEVWAKGNTGNWPAGAGPPAASDHGFMWDVTTLEGQTLTGSQAPVITLNASSSLVATIYVLISKRSSAGAFTTIGTCSLAAQTISTGAAYTITPATFTNVDFATGDKLVYNVWLNITTPGGSNTGTVGISVGNSSTQGTANCAQLTTHYTPTPVTSTRTATSTAALLLEKSRTITTTTSALLLEKSRIVPCSVALSGTDWYGAGWRYQKTLTIAHGQVSGGDQAHFPVLVTFTDNDLKLTPTGKVQNASGYDLIFVDADGITQLDHEVEAYDSTAGTITAWVRIPALSASVDTLITCYFGNTGITTSQENKAGVWDENYLAVYHQGNGTTLSVTDSTRNAKHGTNSGATATPGQIDGAASFNGSSSMVTASSASLAGLGSFSVEFWTQLSAYSGNYDRFVACDDPVTNHVGFDVYLDATLHTADIIIGNGTTSVYGSGVPALSLTTPYKVTFTYDGAHIHSYLNGVEQGTPVALTGTIGTPGYALTLGRAPASVYGYLPGFLDEVRISKTARSGGWDTTSYNNQYTPGTFVSPGITGIVLSSAAKTRIITPVTSALLLEKARTITTVTSALLLEKSRSVTNTASLSAARTFATNAALLVEKKNTAGSTVAFLLEKTRTITTTGAASLMQTRTITTCTVALLVEKTNTAAGSAALLLEKNRPIPSSSPLLQEKSRSVGSSGALSLVGSRSSTTSGSLAYLALTRVAGSSVALLLEKTHTAGSSTALLVEQTRTSGSTVSLLLEKSRAVSTDAALSQLGTLARTVPCNISLSLTKRDISSSAALLSEQSRSAGSSAAFSHIGAESVPTSGTLVLTQSRSIGSSAALFVEKANTCSTSVALSLLGQIHTIPASGSLTTPGTNTRTVPASVALSLAVRTIPASVSVLTVSTRTLTVTVALGAQGARTVPLSGATSLQQVRSVGSSSALLATKTRTVTGSVACSLSSLRTIASSAALSSVGSRPIPSGVALLASQARSIPASTSLLANRIIPGFVALLTISARNVPTSADLSSGIDHIVPCSVALSRVGSRPIPASVILSLFIANARVTVPSGYASLAIKSGAALVTIE